MATPEELQEAFDEIKEELQVLRKNLTLISDDSDFLDERNSLQEEINSKHEEYLETGRGLRRKTTMSERLYKHFKDTFENTLKKIIVHTRATNVIFHMLFQAH